MPASILTRAAKGSFLTHAEVDANWEALRDWFTAAGTLTIAAGAITVTGGYHLVDTEGAAASDNLDTILGASDGDVVVLQSVNTSRVVTLRHNIGNIHLVNGNCVLDDNAKTITLIYSTSLSKWIEVARAVNRVANYLPLSGGTLTGNLSPNADGTLSLGGSSLRWANVYGVSAFFSQALFSATIPYTRFQVTGNTDYSQIQYSSARLLLNIDPTNALAGSAFRVSVDGSVLFTHDTANWTADYTGNITIDLGGFFKLRDYDNADAELFEVSPTAFEYLTYPVPYKVAVPATATSTGTTGQVAFDSNYAYFCTATNTWRRVAIAAW